MRLTIPSNPCARIRIGVRNGARFVLPRCLTEQLRPGAGAIVETGAPDRFASAAFVLEGLGRHVRRPE